MKRTILFLNLLFIICTIAAKPDEISGRIEKDLKNFRDTAAALNKDFEAEGKDTAQDFLPSRSKLEAFVIRGIFKLSTVKLNFNKKIMNYLYRKSPCSSPEWQNSDACKEVAKHYAECQQTLDKHIKLYEEWCKMAGKKQR